MNMMLSTRKAQCFSAWVWAQQRTAVVEKIGGTRHVLSDWDLIGIPQLLSMIVKESTRVRQ